MALNFVTESLYRSKISCTLATLENRDPRRTGNFHIFILPNGELGTPPEG